MRPPLTLRSSPSRHPQWAWRCPTPPPSLQAGSSAYETTALSRYAAMATPTAVVAAAYSGRCASACAAPSRAQISSSSLLTAPVGSNGAPLPCGDGGDNAVRAHVARAATTMTAAAFLPGITRLDGALLCRDGGDDGSYWHTSACRGVARLRTLALASTILGASAGLPAALPLGHAARHASTYTGRSGTGTEASFHEPSTQLHAAAAPHSRGHVAEERGDGESVQTTFGSAHHRGRSAPSATSSRSPSTTPRHASAKAAVTRGGGSDRVSGAVLAAAIMRHHRLHTSLHYLAISSGVEVPECAGGAYHLQERPPLRHSAFDTSAAAASGDRGGYLTRSRTCANNVRISVFPAASLRPAPGTGGVSSSSAPSPDAWSSSTSTSSATAARASPTVLHRDAAHLRAQQYEPFDRLLHRYLERGHVAYITQRLLHHPDAPAPAVLLDTILRHRLPAPSFVCQALLATIHTARRDRSTAAAAGLALDRVAVRLRTDEKARLLYQTPQVRALLLEATLQESLFDTAVDVVTDMPAEWITPHAWSQLVVMAGKSKLPHSQLLWRLLSLREEPSSTLRSSSCETPMSVHPVLTRAGESALLGALRQCPLSASPSAVHLRDVAATVAATAVPHGALDARACATVLAPANGAIGSAVFADATVAGEELPSDEGDEESAQLASGGSEDQPSATPVTAVVPAGSAAGGGCGVRWCAVGAVELGYAVEHHNGDTTPAAGDFRATGAAGALYSHSSFQALLADVERGGVQEGGAAATSPAARARTLWETTALRMINSRHGIVYGLNATMAAQVMLRCGVSFAAQASPLLALHVLRRYLRSCHLLRDQVVAAQRLVEAQLEAAAEGSKDRASRAATTTTASTENPPRSHHHGEKVAAADPYPRLSRAAMPHPAPFLVFFKVMRDARDVLAHAVYGGDEEDDAVTALSGARRYRGTAAAAAGRAHASLPMMHWELVWHTFQQLNCENPHWYTQLDVPEAGDLCLDAMEVLCHGADPWMTLNVARRVSARHIIDGVEMSLWLLNRLDPSHHTDEAREVARKLFRWLLVDVGVHVQPPLHRHLVPAARALIRLGLQEELSTLYNAVLDNVFLFTSEHRDAFIHVLCDLICPACASVLPEVDVYVDRACPNCMAVVPAKDADTIPSFRLSAEHVERQRAQRKQRRQRTRQRLSASVRRLQQGAEGWTSSDAALCHPPRDAAEILRWHLKRDGTEQGGENGALDVPLSSSLLVATGAAAEAPLVPGVSVSTELALFPVAGEAASGVQVLDVRAAMEESSRRLELQRAARRYVLAQRGVRDVADDGAAGAASRVAFATLPTTLPVSAQSLDSSTLKYLSTAANAAAAAGSTLTSKQAVDGAWVCVWCHENNTEWSSRVQCSACGAETGPAAPWRGFAYAAASGDAMEELRGRMSNCEARPVDAVVAGYLLMLYRRTFQLRATPADQDRLLRLVEVLCRLQERVLAGYVYTRFIPVSQRRLGIPLSSLAQACGQDMSPAYRALTQKDLTRPDADDIFFDAVFGAQTCRVCFGQHDWRLCPIVTRDFAASASAAGEGRPRTAISLSPEEKQRAVLERLSQRIHQAVTSLAPSAAEPESAAASSSSPPMLLPPGKPSARLVVDAYTAFVSSPFREIFAELHSSDANRLSLLLSRVQQYRRAAFVLCHVPPPQRATEAYLRMVHYFNVTEAEALALLEQPPTPTPTTPSKGPTASGSSRSGHPTSAARQVNFVQVTQTCCMCLDARHASHTCPRLDEWLKGVQRLALSGSGSTSSGAAGEPSRSPTAAAVLDIEGDARLRRRLKAQVDGWTTAGPERLHAFYRYLIAHVDLLRPVAFASTGAGQQLARRRADFDDPLVYAVNKTIAKLSAVGQRSETYRLYAHTPVEYVSTATTATVLRMNGFSDESVRVLLTCASSSSTDGTAIASDSDSFTSSHCSSLMQHAPVAARAAAVPVRQCCLICFSPDHAFVECPELAAASTEVERLLLVLRNVAGIACVHDGIGAAAAYVYSEYNRGRLSADMMRSHPELVTELLTLTRRCFATRQLNHGVRVLRRIPVEMVPPDAAYVDLWRAAGLPEAEVEQKHAQLLALLDAEAVRPSIDPLPPRPTYTNAFLSKLSRTLHDDLCRHCYEHGHTIATCPLFHAEVSFGRDYVAAYRMSMMSEQLDRAWQEAYLLKLVDFFAAHYLFMPYHIAGVANALNAIASMWSFRGEPGIALRHLLRIPPAYRRRQAFKHVLHCLRVPPAEITKLLGDFYFAPDGNATAVQQQQKGSGPHSTSRYYAQQQQEVVMAQHLLLPKPAIRDVARKQIFDQVPAAIAALEESEERMAEIRTRHERRGEGGGSITAEVRECLLRQQKSEQPGRRSAEMGDADLPHAAASFHAPALRHVMQSGDIAQLREDFDPILSELEDAVGMKLGSRHTLFTSTVDILSAATAAAAASNPTPAPPSPSALASSASSSASTSERSGINSTASSAAAPSSPTFSQTPEAEVVTEVQTRHAQPRRPGSSGDRSHSSRQPSATKAPTTSSAAAAAGAASFSERIQHQAGEGDASEPVGASPGRSSGSKDNDRGRGNMSGNGSRAGDGRNERRDARGWHSNRERNPRHRGGSQSPSHAYNHDRGGRSRHHGNHRNRSDAS
ncbi:conserved hypothetical protein [Leishmania infantum JPCM5]|uniref:Uncharacterized protein n=2 Tax=Leishmania infantum TaxID=5671 RepID=A4HSW1_LEIIN|nr:conserved hypothetical protein [Leishmania infantum JPCM5]CAM65503.1 conserved hypothetical protein [Leishmania infantum JPCM5]|eukprot:XP_001463152.1 conserved hypothetical protein [Leishmania infantum JPCM5]